MRIEPTSLLEHLSALGGVPSAKGGAPLSVVLFRQVQAEGRIGPGATAAPPPSEPSPLQKLRAGFGRPWVGAVPTLEELQASRRELSKEMFGADDDGHA